ncbi:MAG TPA: phosphoribosylglycinamide formyltransferase [Coriobacteriia bacterium]
MAGHRFGILISGSGSNLQAILDACDTGAIAGEVAVVISDKRDAYGLERARKAEVAAVHIDPKAFADRVAYDHAVRMALDEHDVDYVVMAGYMKLLGAEVLGAYPMRVVNIHPALLPSFPGAHGIRDAFDHGVKVTGVTVHFADEQFDQGPIIAQSCVPIAGGDTIEELESRIHAVEHVLYPQTLAAIAEDRVIVEGRKVRIAPR